MTYLMLYNEALEALIARGGRQDVVDAAFAAYNKFALEDFEAWRNTLFLATCATCGESFVPGNDILPTDEPACPTHAPKDLP